MDYEQNAMVLELINQKIRNLREAPDWKTEEFQTYCTQKWVLTEMIGIILENPAIPATVSLGLLASQLQVYSYIATHTDSIIMFQIAEETTEDILLGLI